MLAAVAARPRRGRARCSRAATRLTGPGYDGGYFVGADPRRARRRATPRSRARELFGPITASTACADFEEALALANDSPFGLTAAIHTANVHRAMTFSTRIQAGVAVVNGATYGSEPHMPFGGLSDSGNGWREAGTEALDVYSDLKTVYINHDPRRGVTVTAAVTPVAPRFPPARAPSGCPARTSACWPGIRCSRTRSRRRARAACSTR